MGNFPHKMKYFKLIIFIFFIPILAYAQDGSALDSSGAGTSQALPRATTVSQPVATRTPTSTLIPTPIPVISVELVASPPTIEDQDYDLNLIFLASLVGAATLGGFAALKIKIKKQKQNINRCDSIKELLEQKKRELEAMIKSWPQDQAKKIIEGKIIEELEKNDETRKILEIKNKYDKAKGFIEMLEKRYDLCTLSLPGAGEASYRGTIVENSLNDKEILKNIKIQKTKNDEDWVLHDVSVNEKQIEKFGRYLNNGPWYMNFWKDNKEDMIVVFKDKSFRIKYSDKRTWQEAIEYGKTLGIPEEQLDFSIQE